MRPSEPLDLQVLNVKHIIEHGFVMVTLQHQNDKYRLEIYQRDGWSRTQCSEEFFIMARQAVRQDPNALWTRSNKFHMVKPYKEGGCIEWKWPDEE
jgi:hypothetical protein